jgi:hypothetical protein
MPVMDGISCVEEIRELQATGMWACAGYCGDGEC